MAAGNFISNLLSFFRRNGETEVPPEPAAGPGNGSLPPVTAVWTPKGYKIVRDERTGDEGARPDEHAYVGRAAYGGTDTSPPGAGYGVGRTYD